MTNGRLQSLDFLRGIAILGVVIFHTFIIFDPGIKLVTFIASQGVYGVQLFFFVSAITMSLKWDERFGEERPICKFYVRRFFRIAPPFWLAMIGYLALNGLHPAWIMEEIGLRHILLTASFLHGFWPDTINAIVPGGWSIAVEMTFYAVFPFLAAINASSIFLVLAALAIYLLNVLFAEPALNFIFSGQDADVLSGFLYFQFLNQAPIFLIGMAIFRTLSERTSLLPHLAVAMTWLTSALFLRAHLHSSPLFWAIVAALAALVWFCTSRNVSFRPINRLGQLSYSIYLTHFAIIQGVEIIFRTAGIKDLHSSTAFAAALILTILGCRLCSSILEKTVEKWSAQAGRWAIQKTSTPMKVVNAC